jgi:hypothetical protein
VPAPSFRSFLLPAPGRAFARCSPCLLLFVRSRVPAQVLAVPLAMKPLFPGGIMPVTVTNNRLIKELMEQRRQG